MSNKYIIGYTMVEYFIEDMLIPKKVYSDFERQHGKKPYTEVTEEQLARLNNSKVFTSLLNEKAIRVLDHLPAFALSGEDRATRKLKEAEDKYEAKIAALQAEIEKLKAKK